ncbi:MAG: FAD-dependent thymidylate synthase [candidate division Zixibacteria bacterium]|nr:FAD-dependent thymidylate synthase [candidate division Zixibacteria bacterium]
MPMTDNMDQTNSTSLPAAESCARRIYVMPDLPPEVVAVAFAKTSRSPEPFDQIAAELTATASAKFHEKWVVGYGHASVAEHAVLSLAVENVSILAAKAIEDNRLASYTEKSTRYQVYDPNHVYRPASFASSPQLNQLYESLITTLLSNYQTWHRRAVDWLRTTAPKNENETDRAWETRLRAKACDSIRYLLPTATLTNLGWTVNARALAAAIRKLSGSDIAEFRDIAAELKATALNEVPTLLKYSDPDYSRVESAKALAGKLASLELQHQEEHNDQTSETRLLSCDADGLHRLCCGVAYANQPSGWSALDKSLNNWSTDDMMALLRASLTGLGTYDPLPRTFECLNYLFEVTVDFGAWRDIQRHRIGTQIAQDLSPDLGYAVPQLITEMGLKGEFEDMVGASASVCKSLRESYPAEASYALMLAFRKRTLFNWNLREIFHFVRLRGTAKGHDAYRKVAFDLWREVLEKQPWLGDLLFPLGPDFRR